MTLVSDFPGPGSYHNNERKPQIDIKRKIIKQVRNIQEKGKDELI